MKREFVEVNKEYYQACAKGGRLRRIHYTSNTYDGENREIEKDALVYLPYGYEQSGKAYHVLYLMHGGGGNSDEIFGGVEAATDLKNILDNMIEKEDVEPLIVVAPSFYYEGTTEALTSRKDARELTQNFHHELVKDLIPTIEGAFRVKKGREHRAFGGYSMGSEATWNVFAKCLKEFSYFLPMSGDCWAIQLQGGLHCPGKTVEYLEHAVWEAELSTAEYYIFACVGDKGVAYEPLNTMMQEMEQHTEYFIFGEDFSTGNVVYCVAEGGTHSYEYCYKYIYNALPHFFRVIGEKNR